MGESINGREGGNIPEERGLRQKMVEAAQRLHGRNLLAAADGNISVRLSDQRILITPSGQAKAFMDINDLAVMDLTGEVISGRPSGERLMHLEVYRRCPRAMAVVHAHPPSAIAWSIAFPDLQELPSASLPEVILAAGRIPVVPYARPGTAAMGTQLQPFLPACRVMILARHGALSWGEDLEEAYNGMERLEHAAHILRLARTMGELSVLPDDEIRALHEMRRQLGEKTR